MLFALVGGILGLTGVGVSSYLAQDEARLLPLSGACAETGPLGDDADLTAPQPRCGDLTDVAAPRGRAPLARTKVG